MFISARTMQHHLRKAFAKLGTPRAASWPTSCRPAHPHRRSPDRPAESPGCRRLCPLLVLDQCPGVLERRDLGGGEPELGENTGVVLTLPGRQLALVSHNLVREVPWSARDLYLASRPVGHRAYRPPLACPIAVCELPEGADLSGRDLGLVQLRVERVHVGECPDPLLDDAVQCRQVAQAQFRRQETGV